MYKTRFPLFFTAAALCASLQAEPDSAAAAHTADLSSLARPETFTYELRNVYLTQNIDSMSAGGASSILVGEDFMTQRKTTLAEGTSVKTASSDTSSSSVEDVRRTDKHFGIEGKGELSAGLKWGIKPSVSLGASVSVGGGYGRTSTHTEKGREGHEDETRMESTINLIDGLEQSERQRIKRERELIEGFSLGKYHLRFTVALRNRNPNDTLVVKGNDMRAYLSGPGLPGGIPVPYSEREEIRLGYGETFCEFDYVITDRRQFESLLRLGNQGGLQLLGLKVSGADFPVFSGGKNVLDEQAKWEKNHPSTLVSIGFGDLAGLSPWRVSRKHTKETGRRGTPVTVREALLAVGGAAEKQSETLPEGIFAFSDKRHLATVVDRTLLDRDDDGHYRMFAVLLTKEKGKAEPHLPLTCVLDRNIKDYSEISLFEFTLDEFAQNAVLLPAYFAEVKREVESYLEESDEKDALQYLKNALDKRQSEDDNRDLPDNEEKITASDVERYRLRAEAGVTNMQYTLAVCLLNGWGTATNHVEAVKWFRKAAEQGDTAAQNDLGDCYADGKGVVQDYGEAVKWYRKAAEQGNADAQNDLGDCYADGEGVAQDYGEAVKWYRKAADQGNAKAQNNLGTCYYNGEGVAQDYGEAVKWYRKAAEQGNADAQNDLGVCYADGEGVAQDYGEAVKWYRMAAKQGNAVAENNLGGCYYNGEGVPQDNGEAVKWYRKAAEQGNADAQKNLGSCYYKGEGVAQDYGEAVKWYRKAAEQGDADAQFVLGNCYSNGKGVAQDYAEAVKWYRKVAEQGDAVAQNILGNCYYYGEGVVQDHAEAVKWYRKAADQGHAPAQNGLGVCYHFGEGVTQDHAEAVKWYRKAADQGNAWAQNMLGNCYSAGVGVTQDRAEAVKWYRKAAEQGDELAQTSLGDCFYFGEGVAQDHAEAVKWYRKGADQGNETAVKMLEEIELREALGKKR